MPCPVGAQSGLFQQAQDRTQAHSRVFKAAQGDIPSLAHDCTAAAESCLLIPQVKTAGARAWETEMELGEVKIGG